MSYINLLISNAITIFLFVLQTLYIGSAIACSLFYFLFAAYCQFWLKQPNFEWLPPFCFTFIILFNGMGLSPIPYILLIEIFPKEVCRCIFVDEHLMISENHSLFTISDSRDGYCARYFFGLVRFVSNRIHFPICSEHMGYCCLHAIFCCGVFTQRNFLHNFYPRNAWKVVWRNSRTHG